MWFEENHSMLYKMLLTLHEFNDAFRGTLIFDDVFLVKTSFKNLKYGVPSDNSVLFHTTT